MIGNPVKLTSELVAQETLLGWIISGVIGSASGFSATTLLSINEFSEDSLKNMWDLEVIGITENPNVFHDPVLTEFKQKIITRMVDIMLAYLGVLDLKNVWLAMNIKLNVD